MWNLGFFFTWPYVPNFLCGCGSGYGGSGAPRGWGPGGSGGLDVLIPAPAPMPDFVPEDESISANARLCPSR